MQTTTSTANTSYLTREWHEVHAGTPIPSEWRLIDAGIQELQTLDDLLEEMGPRGRYCDDDTVYLALITRAQAGEELAGRVLLQRLQPRCQQLLRTCARRRLDDRAADVHAAAWNAIITYPLPRTRKVRINLSMQVLHCLPAEENPGWLGGANDLRDLMTDGQATLTSWAADTAPAGSLSTCDEVSELLLWAMDHEILTRDESALIYQATIGATTSTRAALEEMATHAGVTGRCMRKRYSRAANKVAAAVAATT